MEIFSKDIHSYATVTMYKNSVLRIIYTSLIFIFIYCFFYNRSFLTFWNVPRSWIFFTSRVTLLHLLYPYAIQYQLLLKKTRVFFKFHAHFAMPRHCGEWKLQINCNSSGTVELLGIDDVCLYKFKNPITYQSDIFLLANYCDLLNGIIQKISNFMASGYICAYIKGW